MQRRDVVVSLLAERVQEIPAVAVLLVVRKLVQSLDALEVHDDQAGVVGRALGLLPVGHAQEAILLLLLVHGRDHVHEMGVDFLTARAGGTQRVVVRDAEVEDDDGAGAGCVGVATGFPRGRLAAGEALDDTCHERVFVGLVEEQLADGRTDGLENEDQGGNDSITVGQDGEEDDLGEGAHGHQGAKSEGIFDNSL